MITKTRIVKGGLVLSVLLLLPVPNVFAEHYDYNNRISLGTYFISRYETEIGLSDTNSGIGASIDPRAALGLDNQKQVLRLDGHYRFNDEHSVLYSWYAIKSTGNRTVDEEIPWDPPIQVGARVESTINTDIYKVGYLWSFHNSDKVELGIGAGLNISRIRIQVSADTAGDTYKGESVATALPLPVAIFKLAYNLTPELELTYLSQLFGLGFEGVSGLYSDQAITLEYKIWKHVALGLGINTTNMALEQEKDGRILKFNNNLTGGMLFISGYF